MKKEAHIHKNIIYIGPLSGEEDVLTYSPFFKDKGVLSSAKSGKIVSGVTSPLSPNHIRRPARPDVVILPKAKAPKSPLPWRGQTAARPWLARPFLSRRLPAGAALSGGVFEAAAGGVSGSRRNIDSRRGCDASEGC